MSEAVANSEQQDELIRAAIMQLVAQAAPQAITHTVWVMGLVAGDNANILRSPAHTNTAGDAQIHAWMISRLTGTNENATETTTTSARRATQTISIKGAMKYRLRVVRFFQHGGASGDHSQDDLTREVFRVFQALAKARRLSLDATVEGHDDLQIEKEFFDTYGRTFSHVGDYTITVRLVQTVNP